MSESSIHLYLKVGVPADRKTGFETLMKQLVAEAEEESGTLIYEWYFSEDGETCHIQERYADEVEGDKHVKNFAENYANRFFDHVNSVKCVVSANASSYIRSVLDGIEPTYVTKVAGFNRF